MFYLAIGAATRNGLQIYLLAALLPQPQQYEHSHWIQYNPLTVCERTFNVYNVPENMFLFVCQRKVQYLGQRNQAWKLERVFPYSQNNHILKR